MIDGPHIFRFSPDALCINLTRALASARLVWSVSASMNTATLNLVGLVLFSAIHPAFRLSESSSERRIGAHGTARAYLLRKISLKFSQRSRINAATAAVTG